MVLEVETQEENQMRGDMTSFLSELANLCAQYNARIYANISPIEGDAPVIAIRVGWNQHKKNVERAILYDGIDTHLEVEKLKIELD